MRTQNAIWQADMIFLNLDNRSNDAVARRLLERDRDIVCRDELFSVYRAVRFVADRDVDLLNSIYPESGEYLSVWEMERVVKAEISEQETAEIIMRRKKAFEANIASFDTDNIFIPAVP